MPGVDLTGQLEAERDAAKAELAAAFYAAFPEGSRLDIAERLVEAAAADARVALGSVSRHVVQHARCPVVVVKAKKDD